MQQPSADESPSDPTELAEAIVVGITERTGAEPTDLPPLYDAIDVDALEQLVLGHSSFEVSFEYAGHEVLVTETGQVSVREMRPDGPDECGSGTRSERVDT